MIFSPWNLATITVFNALVCIFYVNIAAAFHSKYTGHHILKAFQEKTCDLQYRSLEDVLFNVEKPGQLSRCSDGLRVGKPRQDFPLLHNVQTGSGAHPVSYPMANGYWGSFPSGKAAAAWSWPLYCRGQEEWRYISTSPYVQLLEMSEHLLTLICLYYRIQKSLKTEEV
jgi:hypothetical protein